GAPDPFRLANEQTAAQMLMRAGFTNVHTERLMVKFEFPSADAYAQWCVETQAPIPALFASQPPEKKAAILQVITQFAQQYAGAGGAVSMPFESVLLVGQREYRPTVSCRSRKRTPSRQRNALRHPPPLER